MAFPFWMAMETESSSCFAASCRDQSDKCSAAAPLMTSSRVTASDAMVLCQWFVPHILPCDERRQSAPACCARIQSNHAVLLTGGQAQA